jgi:hypothetical protein
MEPPIWIDISDPTRSLPHIQISTTSFMILIHSCIIIIAVDISGNVEAMEPVLWELSPLLVVARL